MKAVHFAIATAMALANMPAWANSSQTISSWGMIEGPDGKTWNYTTLSTMVDLGNEYYTDLRYQTMDVSVFDASHEPQGTFRIDVSGLNANALDVFGPITQHLFNNDDLYEIGVDIHIPGSQANNYTSQNLFMAYNFEGTRLMESEGTGVIVANGKNSFLVLDTPVADKTWGKSAFQFCQCAADGQGIEVVKEVVFDNMLLEYMNGPVLNFALLNDGLHFILAHYEKPLPKLDKNGEVIYNPETWMPFWTPDNHFVIENYDEHLELVDETKVSTDCPKGVEIRTMGIGSFSNQDITQGYYTGDDRYNYIITCEDTNEQWNLEYAFEVYAQGGDHTGLLCDKVSDFWNKLTSIEGEPDQWVFLTSDAETGEQQIAVVETPSFQRVNVIPAILDGKLISANIDRIADEAEGYKYVIGLNEADMDEDENILAQYGFYHKDLTVDHYLKFNMDKTAETFTPLLNSESLDPHLFYADDQREFIFLAKLQGADGEMYNTLFIGNEEGKVLRTWSAEGTTKGNIRQVAILNYGTEQPELFICYYDWDNDTYENEFIPLPLTPEVGISQIGSDMAGAHFFNLQGQPTSPLSSGLMIRNGEKVSVTR